MPRMKTVPPTSARLSTSTWAVLLLLLPLPALAGSATVLYSDRVVEVEATLDDPDDLWVQPHDLTRVNDFVLKPEGACLDELCIPVPQDRDSAFLKTGGEQTWFNVTELARTLDQAYVAEREADAWSLGPIPVTRTSYLESAVAPDFAIPGRDGKIVRLSDFRGKKVLLFTWASW